MRRRAWLCHLLCLFAFASASPPSAELVSAELRIVMPFALPAAEVRAAMRRLY